jgi:hypothetical protein
MHWDADEVIVGIFGGDIGNEVVRASTVSDING